MSLADCSLVSADDAAQLLGYAVSAAGRIARVGGICSYASRAASEDGVVSYAFVTTERLAALRPFYTVLARGCGGGKRSPACVTYIDLATVRDVATYYAVRSAMAGAAPVDGIGDGATSAGGTLYVRHGTSVLETVVRRDGAFDLERSERLARLLLGRIP